jgi:hypothetical protein
MCLEFKKYIAIARNSRTNKTKFWFSNLTKLKESISVALRANEQNLSGEPLSLSHSQPKRA